MPLIAGANLIQILTFCSILAFTYLKNPSFIPMSSSCCSKQRVGGVGTNKLSFRMTSSSLLASLPRVKDALWCGMDPFGATA